jgi:ABC-type sugar transport system ATPase subunit
MAELVLESVSKTFPGGQAAVRELTLTASDGELLVLVGPSGSGKSTVLRLIAGLEVPTSGRILVGGQDVTEVPPQQRDLAMVFQNYALYPHKTVGQNLAFGLRVRGTAAKEIHARVARTASMLGIDHLLDRRPAQLSGGQRQRVALGRALVREPRAFLLDEPLSNLDPRLRTSTRTELALLHRRLQATMVYVTHDQEEAMTLGDRVAVMHDGRLEQVAAPLDLFRAPANAFVAGFIGSPAMNLWKAQLGAARDHLSVGPLSIDLERRAPAGPDHVLVGIRPHDISSETAAPDVRGRIEVLEPLGATTLAHVRVDGLEPLIRLQLDADASISVGASIGLRLRQDRLHYFDSASGRRL